jgi:hypothetical protein
MNPMKKLKLYAVLVALVVAIAGIPITATAGQPSQYIPIQPLWENVNTARANVTISGTTATCTVTIIGLSGTTSITAAITLQRVSDGRTVATWNRTANDTFLTFSGTAAVTAGGRYRLNVRAIVTRNGVAEVINFSG